LKIVQIEDFSVSKLKMGVNPLFFDHQWHIVLGSEIAKRTYKYTIECWQPERTLRRQYTRAKEGVLIRKFPSFYPPVPSRKLATFEFSLQLLRELRRQSQNEPTLIHMHNLHSPFSYLIAYLFDKNPIVFQDHCSSPPGLLQKLLPERIPYQNVDHFFVLTREREEYLSKIVGPEKVEFQTLGIDLNMFRPRDKERARIKLDLQLDHKVILSVCNLEERKGIEYALRAVRCVISKYPKVLYLVVGSNVSDYATRLRKLAEDLKISEHVRFLGRVEPNTLLAWYYNAADVFLLPSLAEGIPATIKEAMASGVPVVATRVGGIANVIENQKTGLIVRPGDVDELATALLIFFQEQWEPGVCRESAVRKFDWDTIVARTLEVYEELFARYFGD